MKYRNLSNSLDHAEHVILIYMKQVTVHVQSKLQKSYTYIRTEPVGKNFAGDFRPMLTPQEMLELGIFGDGILRKGLMNSQRIGGRKQSFRPPGNH